MRTLLSCEKLTGGYNGLPVVREVSLEVRPGEFIGLLGRNGVGKTTLLKLLTGHLQPLDGRVFWQEQDIGGRPLHEVARLGIVYVPEEGGVFRTLSVADNLILSDYDRPPFARGLVRQLAAVLEHAKRVIRAFDIRADGGLSNRRVWADNVGPDGICLDADGAVWAQAADTRTHTGRADSPAGACIRVEEGGTVLQRIEHDRAIFAAMLGGPDRRTLFMLAADWRGVDGVESAIAQARTIAGEKSVVVASTTIVQQCLKARLLDEIHITLQLLSRTC